MKKRIFGLICAMALTASVCPARAEAVSEKFMVKAGMLTERQIEKVQQNFTPLDLKTFANRDIKDDVEGDGTGGWSDQGSNDLHMFNLFGRQEMLGIPFDFIDPAANGRKAVVALRGQNDMELPNMIEVPVNRTLAGAYFIQASPWCSGTCGWYTWVYEDGSEATVDIVQNVYICDFWGYKEYDYCRPVWTTVIEDGSNRSLYLFPMSNPHPEKKVKHMRLSTAGDAAYIMIMAITLTDKGPYLPATSSAKMKVTSSYGWFDHDAQKTDIIPGSAADMSCYLDAPAGKHGRLKADGEKLVFDDGTEARLWGVDIKGKACFPEKDAAADIAAQIASMGVNLVRFRAFDELLCANTCSELDAGMWDKLSFFVSELEKRGIYIYLTGLSRLELTAADGVTGSETLKPGIGTSVFFDDELQNVFKKYLNEMLTANNEYTGKAFRDDPAVAMIELCDGFSAFDYATGSGRENVDDARFEKLSSLFNSFLVKRYGTSAALKTEWTEWDVREDQSLEDGSVTLEPSWKSVLHSQAYESDAADFFAELEADFGESMKQVTGDMLLTPSSNSLNNIQGKASAGKCDFVAAGTVFAKSPAISDKLDTVSPLRVYTDPVSDPEGSGFKALINSAYADKPFAGGYGAGLHNIYSSSLPLMAAALGGQNGWIPIQYTYASDVYGSYDCLDDFYAIYNNPVKRALTAASASVFHTLPHMEDKAVEETHRDFGTADITLKQGITENARRKAAENAKKRAKEYESKIIKSNNIYWEPEAKIFEVRTPYAEGLTGSYGVAEEMPSFIITVDNMYFTAVLTALDGKQIKNADRLLLTAVNGVMNTGSDVSLIRHRYMDTGTAPIQIESVTGSVELKLDGEFSVYVLDENGERKERIAAQKNKAGRPAFDMSAQDATVRYEIVRRVEQ